MDEYVTLVRMAEGRFVRVPVGHRADQWTTVGLERSVLLVSHNVTTITRLLDVIDLFDSDFRVQVVISFSGTDPFSGDLDELFAKVGMVAVPWAQALRMRFDLAIAASHHGGLADIDAPLVILAHGVGFSKLVSPGVPKGIGGESAVAHAFGLSPQWVLYDSRPVAAALVLSHPEQLDRLSVAAPAAAPSAVVAGDPTYDRMLASVGLRQRYRRELGVDDGRTVVMLSTTWSRNSLLGSDPGIFKRLLAELPLDSYRVVAALHPNVWQGHGSWQLRSWLADCLRSGLILVPPLEGWRAALIAADCVIGDHGSVTCYGAALGKPVLLGAFPEDEVAPGSAVDMLGRIAARVSPHEPLRNQVNRAIVDHSVDHYGPVSELVTSLPGETASRLRSLFYQLLRLSEPDGEVLTRVIPTAGLPGAGALQRVSAVLAGVELNASTRTLVITRFPAELHQFGVIDRRISAPHFVVHIHHPQARLKKSAAILTIDESELCEAPSKWLAETLDSYPECWLSAVAGDARVLLQARTGQRVELSGGDEIVRFVSVVYCWLVLGCPLGDLGPSIKVDMGTRQYDLRIRTM